MGKLRPGEGLEHDLQSHIESAGEAKVEPSGLCFTIVLQGKVLFTAPREEARERVS